MTYNVSSGMLNSTHSLAPFTPEQSQWVSSRITVYLVILYQFIGYTILHSTIYWAAVSASCTWLSCLYTHSEWIHVSCWTTNKTRNVGMPPSRWCGKFYDVGNSMVVIVGSCRIFRGWVTTTVLFLATSRPKFMKFWDDVGDPL